MIHGKQLPDDGSERAAPGGDPEESALLDHQRHEGGLALEQVGGGLGDLGEDALEAPAGQEAGGEAAQPLEFAVTRRRGGQRVAERPRLAAGQQLAAAVPGPGERGREDRQEEADEALVPDEVDAGPAAQDGEDGERARGEESLDCVLVAGAGMGGKI